MPDAVPFQPSETGPVLMPVMGITASSHLFHEYDSPARFDLGATVDGPMLIKKWIAKDQSMLDFERLGCAEFERIRVLKIVIDTSVICADFLLRKPGWRVLEATIPSNSNALFVPHVVIKETANKYRDQLIRAASDYQDKVEKLQRFVPANMFGFPPLNSILEISDTYEQTLISRLSSLGEVLTTFPQISHEVLVERDLARRKPFEKTGKGYRDALIWEEILGLAGKSQEPVVLITENLMDFADERDRPVGLHPDLKADLIRLDIPEERVALYPSLEEFVDAFKQQFESDMQEEQDRLSEILNELSDQEFEGLDLIDVSRERLPSLLNGYDLEGLNLGLSYDYENPEISFVEDVEALVVEDVVRLPSGELLVTAVVDTLCQITVWLFRSEWYAMTRAEEREIVGGDDEWNDHYGYAEIMRDFAVAFDLTFNEAGKEVTSFGIRSVSRPIARQSTQKD